MAPIRSCGLNRTLFRNPEQRHSGLGEHALAMEGRFRIHSSHLNLADPLLPFLAVAIHHLTGTYLPVPLLLEYLGIL
jgi:hypothetical protein